MRVSTKDPKGAPMWMYFAKGGAVAVVAVASVWAGPVLSRPIMSGFFWAMHKFDPRRNSLSSTNK